MEFLWKSFDDISDAWELLPSRTRAKFLRQKHRIL